MGDQSVNQIEIVTRGDKIESLEDVAVTFKGNRYTLQQILDVVEEMFTENTRLKAELAKYEQVRPA